VCPGADTTGEVLSSSFFFFGIDILTLRTIFGLDGGALASLCIVLLIVLLVVVGLEVHEDVGLKVGMREGISMKSTSTSMET
jgi:hypothetical protein